MRLDSNTIIELYLSLDSLHAIPRILRAWSFSDCTMKVNIDRHQVSDVLSPSILIPSVLSIFVSLVAYRLFFHPLKNVPGPFLARITELWRTSKYFKGTWHTDILELHRRYGSVVRISPNEVSVVHPDLVTTIYSHSKGTAKVTCEL